MSFTPLELISAHQWQHVTFTTYALSLSFFEAVILDGLVRGGSVSQPLILADVHGVRESLSEQGAHRVGKDYEVEPIAVSGGVFHPKITVLASGDECHLLVGSGNLTFNGWGGNCEMIEHLHSGFASNAIVDVADFFDRLAASHRVRQGASERCAATASVLRRAVQGQPQNGDIRILHSFDASVADQIAQAAEDLGGAQRLVAAAPFWDSGAALDDLCRALGVEEAFLHAHAKGCVQGTIGANWPRHASVAVKAVRVAPMDAPSEARRPLHAKAFEILCRHGRLLVSGSANGTSAGLGRDGNIEACVLRIQRERSVGWTLASAVWPEVQGAVEDNEESALSRAGVLRAVLEGDEVLGQVLTPNMSGVVKVYHLAALGPELLVETLLDEDSGFRFAAPGLETWSWRGGRLVIRVVDATGRKAEGFVSIASFAEIARRGGLVTRHLFAVIFGNETPEDVTAILSWFLEDPHRLSRGSEGIRGGGNTEEDGDSDQLVPVAALDAEFAANFAHTASADGTQWHWSRFLDQVFAAFRERRGAFGATGSVATGDGDDDDDGDEPAPQQKKGEKSPASDKAYASFSQLFGILTKDGNSPRHYEVAFDLTGYICARLQPEVREARTWLERVIRVWLIAGVRTDRRDDVATAILTVLGSAREVDRFRWARSCLLRLGLDLATPPPFSEAVHNYRAVLLQQEKVDALWTKLQRIRTFQEQVHAYINAVERGQPAPGDYPELPVEAPEAWAVLADAFGSPQVKASLLVTNVLSDTCPVHHISLPQQEVHRLRRVGIAITKNCCRRVVIRREN